MDCARTHTGLQFPLNLSLNFHLAVRNQFRHSRVLDTSKIALELEACDDDSDLHRHPSEVKNVDGIVVLLNLTNSTVRFKQVEGDLRGDRLNARSLRLVPGLIS